MSSSPFFHTLLAEMAEIHHRKNADYAADHDPFSNFRFAARVAALFEDPLDQVMAAELAKKIARLGNLKRAGKTPKNEPIADSHLDLATYAAIWGALDKERRAALESAHGAGKGDRSREVRGAGRAVRAARPRLGATPHAASPVEALPRRGPSGARPSSPKSPTR